MEEICHSILFVCKTVLSVNTQGASMRLDLYGNVMIICNSLDKRNIDIAKALNSLLIRDLVRFNYLIIGKNRIDYRILASIFRITSVMVIFTDVTRYSFILGRFCKKNSMFLTISQIK